MSVTRLAQIAPKPS